MKQMIKNNKKKKLQLIWVVPKRLLWKLISIQITLNSSLSVFQTSGFFTAFFFSLTLNLIKFDTI